MASRDPARPNVVFILTDDQGPWALGCAGNPEIHTPNLDRLAARGTRFDRFFCTSPVCSPARASLLTGLIPSAHGVHDWIRAGNVGPDAVDFLRGRVTSAELLAAHGYVCGLSGKWHLGDSATPRPGFTHWYAHQSGGGSYNRPPMVRDGRLVTERAYVTDLITDDALAFIGENAVDDRPFYTSVHYTAPHSPWIGEHPDRFTELYRDCAFASCPPDPAHRWALPETVPKGTSGRRLESLRGYFAAVSALDAGVGRLLDRLDDLALTESTLVWFTSDNGFNCGHHGIWGKGNGTFPQNMYDTSVLVPTIISQPGRIPAGVVRSDLLSGYDVMPTLLDQVGVSLPEGLGAALPGRSFAPLLRGEGAPDGDRGIVVYDEYGPVRMVRNHEYKYVHRYPYGPHELYDMVHDPAETVNLLDDPARREIVREMRANLDRWFTRYADPGKDGARQPVTGKGQGGLVDPGVGGTIAGPTFFSLDAVPARGGLAPAVASRCDRVGVEKT